MSDGDDADPRDDPAGPDAGGTDGHEPHADDVPGVGMPGHRRPESIFLARRKRRGVQGFMSRPVHPRFRIRRSTLLIAVLFAGLGIAYLEWPPAATGHPQVGGGTVDQAPSPTTSTSSTTTTAPPATSTTTTTTTAPSATSTTTQPQSSTTTTRPTGGSATTTTVSPAVASTTTTTPAANSGATRSGSGATTGSSGSSTTTSTTGA